MAFFKLLKQSPWSARLGLAMVLLNVFAALFTPFIAPYSETEIVGDVWLPMSKDHWLGTDHLGRDLYTRLLYGARNTIAIAFVTTLLSFVVGTILGFFAATLGGWTDLTLSRFIDILMALPDDLEKRFVEKIIEEVLNSDIKNVAKRNDLSEQEIETMLKDLGADLVTEKPKNLKKLGIDEIAVVKGQRNYYVILVDLEKKKVIGMIEKRTKKEKLIIVIVPNLDKPEPKRF